MMKVVVATSITTNKTMRYLLTSSLLFFQLCASENILSSVQAHVQAAGGGVADLEVKQVKIKPRNPRKARDKPQKPLDGGTNRSIEDAATPSSVDTANYDYVCHEDDVKYGSCQAPSSADEDTSLEVKTGATLKPCGVYLAMSTLPGTGIGMFAGRDYEEGEDMLELGDHIIPLVDMPMHQGKGDFFLWDEYTWDPTVVRADGEALSEVNVASPGFGAAANSFMDFVNVDEGEAIMSTAHKLHRSKDPGLGGFSTIHSREATAQHDIKAGDELFVSYGNHWFLERSQLGPVPIEGQHAKAQKLYKLYKDVVDKHNKTLPKALMEELWDEFVVNTNWNSSRIIAALPPKEAYEEMLEIGLVEYKTNKMVRSQEWLQEYGVCADNMRIKESTFPQAGHGAFANRLLAKGSVILPVPFIHIPDAKVFEMYEIVKGGDASNKRRVDLSKVAGYQLLLNYCLGHADSTMLLSPYGPVFNLINHNQTLANVRLQWADPKRSNFHPELLEKSVSHFYNVSSSQLSMELVALRDIHPDEEILLDYGDAWEAAWQEHVKNWKPIEGAKDYISAEMMNKDTSHLLTEFEQMKTPYPANLVLKFDKSFAGVRWRKPFKKGDVLGFKKRAAGDWIDCEILKVHKTEDGIFMYTASIFDGEDDDPAVVRMVPREAFVWQDRPYTSDMLLPNAFRHEIRIPDDIFPDAWKNKKQGTPPKVEQG